MKSSTRNFLSFEINGIDTSNFAAKKLWRVSRILGIMPWDERLLEMTNPQMDFVLAMYAQDHPDELSIKDPRMFDGSLPSQIFNEWSNSFSGETLKEFARNPQAYLLKYFKYRLQT